MYCYDYRISLRVQHPTEAGAGIAARLDLEPAFSRDVGTGYRDRDGSLISGHAETRVVFVLEWGKDGWLMDAWPALVDLLRARADVIGELLQEGASIGVRVGIFGKTAWAGSCAGSAVAGTDGGPAAGFSGGDLFPGPGGHARRQRRGGRQLVQPVAVVAHPFS